MLKSMKGTGQFLKKIKKKKFQKYCLYPINKICCSNSLQCNKSL
jgi:hypothetical protein